MAHTDARRLLVVLLVAVGALALPVRAAADLIQTDWRRGGDGKTTVDTATGLEWLDLTESIGSDYTYDYVTSQFGRRGEFAGFRYATLTEGTDALDQRGNSGSDWCAHRRQLPARPRPSRSRGNHAERAGLLRRHRQRRALSTRWRVRADQHRSQPWQTRCRRPHDPDV